MMVFYISVKKLYNHFTICLQFEVLLLLADKYVLDAILATEDDAITVINKDKIVLYWNESAVATYNITKEEILNQSIIKFFEPKDLMVLKVLESEEEVKNLYHRPREDKHVVINTSLIQDDTGKIIGAVSVERDITQIVKLNNNLESTSQELNELRMRIKNGNEASPFSNLKGRSVQLQETIQTAWKAAKTDATTLILGESGTGKEVCARAIHEASPRNNGPFVPVNCGAIPYALFESELFGYEAGSFTGAAKEGKPGKIEMAREGTLFLDEIGELPLEMQVKLLRVLQENRIYRIGDSIGQEVDVRFIAATNQDLPKMMLENKFRSDLYYRLNVIQLTMPPLRERLDDIPNLAQGFLEQFALKYHVPILEIDQAAIHILLQYSWPGNVRELKNMMERLVILAEQPIIKEQELVKYFPNILSSQFQEVKHATPLAEEKENIEKVLIEDTLRQTNGNKSDAARRLGISRVTLYNKIKKYEIEE